MDVGRSFAIRVFLDKQLEDPTLIEIMDRCVGSEDGEPGTFWGVLGQDGSCSASIRVFPATHIWYANLRDSHH